MKITVLARVTAHFRQAAGWVESLIWGVRVVAIQCRRCGEWVDAAQWDPQAAVCDGCACMRARSARKPRRKAGVRMARTGGAR